MTHKMRVKMVQFGVNSKKATTINKLQGVSLNRMVIRSWSYKFPNWIYIALSRVRTLSGFFICEKSNENKKFDVEPNLLEEEKRLQIFEKKLIN